MGEWLVSIAALPAVAVVEGAVPVAGWLFDPALPWWRDKNLWQLLASLLMSMATAAVAFFLARYGLRLDRAKTMNQELTKKRLAVYDAVAPQINDIYCYISFVGAWKSFTLDDIVARKRSADRQMFIYRALFDSEVIDTYFAFIDLAFKHYARAGLAALVRLDVRRARDEWGDAWQAEWDDEILDDPAPAADFDAAYWAFLEAFGRAIGVERDATVRRRP